MGSGILRNPASVLFAGSIAAVGCARSLPAPAHVSARTDVHARFGMHPSQESLGGPYGYESGVREGNGRSVDLVRLPAGGATRIVLHLAGVDDSARLVLRAGAAFEARVDTFSKGRCVVGIRAIPAGPAEPGPAPGRDFLRAEVLDVPGTLDSIRVEVVPQGR